MIERLAEYLGMPPDQLVLILEYAFGAITTILSVVVIRQRADLRRVEAASEQAKSRNEARLKEAETDLQQVKLGFSALERTLMLLGQQNERHAQTDERHAANQAKAIEAEERLASAIEALTKSTQTSQSWQEKRAEDYLETVGAISERTAGINTDVKATLSKVELISSGLEDVKKQLDVIARHNPNKEALERVEREIGNLIILVRDHIPKPPPPVPIPLAEAPPDGVTSVVSVPPLQNEALQQTPPENKDESKEEK
jgi:hypothetical protein